MLLKPISQCNKALDFHPNRVWPSVLPALSWRGYLLCGFERDARGEALEIDGTLIEGLKAAHPELGLAEFSRLIACAQTALPDFQEFRESLAAAYGLRWNDRLAQTLDVLVRTPAAFQTWADEKKVGARDLAALLALPEGADFLPFLGALAGIPISKAEGIRALELAVELFLMGRPLNDLLPSSDNAALWVRRLEQWRRPMVARSDEQWREDVARWPWPAHVQGAWQRFGDQAGLEIKLRATSADDLKKKLERLNSIGETWSCKS